MLSEWPNLVQRLHVSQASFEVSAQDEDMPTVSVHHHLMTRSWAGASVLLRVGRYQRPFVRRDVVTPKIIKILQAVPATKQKYRL